MSMFDFLGYLIISSKLVKGNFRLLKQRKIVQIVFFILFLSTLMSVVGISSIGKYSFIFGLISSISLIYFLHGTKVIKTIHIYVISTIILLVIQFLVLAMFIGLNIDEVVGFKAGILAQLIIIPIEILIYKFLPINLLMNFYNKNNKLFLGLVANMFIILGSILIYRYIEMDGLLKDIFIIATLLIGILFVNLVLIRDGIRNEYEVKMLKTYEKYFPVIEELMKELRSKQHDFDNHIQAINMLSVTSNNHESIVNSMKKYVEELEFDIDIRKLIKLENKVLAGFLYEKAIKAKDKNIEFQIVIEDYGFETNLRDYELIEVIGNLIDNAFETNVDENQVRLILKREKDENVIEVKNKHPYLSNETISQLFKPSYSTKSYDGHGLGLPNVKKITKKYNGIIDVQNENIGEANYVVFRVLLN